MISHQTQKRLFILLLASSVQGITLSMDFNAFRRSPSNNHILVPANLLPQLIANQNISAQIETLQNHLDYARATGGSFIPLTPAERNALPDNVRNALPGYGSRARNILWAAATGIILGTIQTLFNRVTQTREDAQKDEIDTIEQATPTKELALENFNRCLDRYKEATDNTKKRDWLGFANDIKKRAEKKFPGIEFPQLP